MKGLLQFYLLLRVLMTCADAFLSLLPPTAIPRQRQRLAVVVTQETSQAGSDFTNSVDMNIYNLENLDAITQEWSAVVVAATPLMPEGIYLQPRNKDKYMADSVKVAFPRLPGLGLGLELMELAGGREDGIGITIVSGLVEGGAAEGSGILPGDSVVKVELQSLARSASRGVEESEDIFSIPTECLGYDKTVEAILALPPPDESLDATFVLTVKRLRRKPKVQLNLKYPPEMKENDVSLELFAGENLRRAMLVRGVKLNDPLAARFDSGGTGDCGAEGTCATCAVAVVEVKIC